MDYEVNENLALRGVYGNKYLNIFADSFDNDLTPGYAVRELACYLIASADSFSFNLKFVMCLWGETELFSLENLIFIIFYRSYIL